MSAAAKTISPEAPLLPEKLRNTRALWIVLIIMALLAGCALLFARGAMRLSGDWQTQLSDTMSVQIMLENTREWGPQTQAARSELLAVLPGADVEIISQAAARDMLKPWLGNTALPDDLPIPALLQITGSDLSSNLIQTTLDEAGFTAVIDDNSRYADRLQGTARKLVLIGVGILILILSAGLAVNVFATRAAMTAQKEIIRVLVQVGATDKFISRLFIRQAAMRGAVGAFFGLGLAGMTWFILSILGDWGGLGWTGFSAGLVDLLWLIILGFIFTFICSSAAGVTALKQLSFERKRL